MKTLPMARRMSSSIASNSDDAIFLSTIKPGYKRKSRITRLLEMTMTINVPDGNTMSAWPYGVSMRVPVYSRSFSVRVKWLAEK